MQYPDDTVSYQQAITKVLYLSDSMVLHASTSEWERVEKLEEKRNEIIQYLTVPEKSNAEIELTIQRIIDANEQLVTMGNSELNKRMSEVSKIKRSKKGITAYESI